MTDDFKENPEEQEDDSMEDSDTEPDEEQAHPIDDWVVVFESRDIMEAELVEARLDDEKIEYYTINKQDLGYTVEIGTYWTFNSGKPVIIFVRPENQEKAIAVIDEDRSKLLDDPNLDFSGTD